MPLKISLFLLGFVFFLSPKVVEAGLVINEIMYDPAGSDGTREWIEVYNNGGSSVDFGAYKFFEANTNHGLTLISGDANIPSGGYAIIASDPASFQTDWPGVSSAIFDSSFSLNNTGELLALKDGDGNITDQYTYSSTSGGNDDGNSLQLLSGAWSGNSPTPGEANETSSGGGDEEDEEEPDDNSQNSGSSGGTSSSSSSASSVSSKSSTKSTEPDTKVKVFAPKIVFTNTPFELKGSSSATGGKYFWNFGDGNSKESRESVPFPYTYFYEGEYVVTAEYYSRSFSKTPDSTAKVTIKAVPMEISISRVGDASDFFIELSNNTGYEVDVSNWTLSSMSKKFNFPRNTTILPKKKIILPSRVTGFNLADKNNLELFNKEGELVYNYNYGGLPPTKKEVLMRSPLKPYATPVITSKEESILSENVNLFLPATPIQAEEKSTPIYFYVAGLVFLVGVSAVGVYFIRRRGVNAPETEDFELID